MAVSPELLAEAQRQLGICNACRYCEGYCATFPALEARARYEAADVAYLANLCHDCGACVQACMYAPPHEFAVDIRTLLSDVRRESYAMHAWPRRLAFLFSHGWKTLAVATIVGFAVAVAIALGAEGGAAFARHSGDGAFYEVVPYRLLLVASFALSGWALAVLVGGFRSFRRASEGSRPAGRRRSWLRALDDVARLVWLRGGGEGCYYPSPKRASGLRRWLHAALFYGLLLAFAATVVAAIYQHGLGDDPPYPLASPPVVLGVAGGAGMVVGATGLLLLKPGNRIGARRTMRALDYAFLVALELAAVTGIALLALRSTVAMGSLLIVHLAAVYALYLSAPYGKFVHAVYRLAALVVFHRERARERKDRHGGAAGAA
jgi:citrate/tricarballylate utilization protein